MNGSQFLEFSVHAPDIADSLAWYKLLGFAELPIGEIWSHRYAVVSDGELCIGLHDRNFDAPAVTFVLPELARHARSMADHGFDFSFMRLDEDVFNEIGLADYDGHTIAMQEARTFHAGDDERDSACGRFFELTLPVRDTMHSARFWAPLSTTVLRLREEPTMHMRFAAGGIALGLSESMALDRPALCFKCGDRNALAALIERHAFEHTVFPGFEGAFLKLEAPEGTPLYVFQEDFLGEPIVVDESPDAAGFPA